TKAALEALADGTLSFDAEYNPLFGEQALEAVNTVLDGGDVESYIQLESTTFDSPAAAAEALPDRKYCAPAPAPALTRPRSGSPARSAAEARPSAATHHHTLHRNRCAAPARRSSRTADRRPNGVAPDARTTDCRDDWHLDLLPRGQGAGRRRLPPVPGRGPRP